MEAPFRVIFKKRIIVLAKFFAYFGQKGFSLTEKFKMIDHFVNFLSLLNPVLFIRFPITRIFTVTENDIAIFSCIIIDRT